MFVRDFIHIDRPFEAVAPRFVADPSWLVPIAERAATAAVELSMSLAWSPADASRRLTLPRVRCETGSVRAVASSLFVPLRLVDLDRGDHLPDLTGDLEVTPVGPDRSLLAFSATYRRPTSDSHALHRVERAAEFGVRVLLTGIAADLASRDRSAGGEP